MRIFYILSIILLFTALEAKSQTNTPASQFPAAKVTRFYPNPAVSQITFDIDETNDKNVSFQVYDFLGKKVYELANVTTRTVVNVSNFYRGMYIFQLRDKTGRMLDSGKFQVSH